MKPVNPDPRPFLERLAYDPETGRFTWAATRHRVSAGAAAGSLSRGYLIIRTQGRGIGAHRLAWLFAHGSFPAGEIDHINRNKLDNRIANLRLVTRSENVQNVDRARSNSKTGVLGVHRRGKRFRSRIQAGAVIQRIGTFATLAEASAAYQNAKAQLHTGFAK